MLTSMNSFMLRRLVFVFSLLLSAFTFGQVDSLNKVNSQEDSLIVIVPEISDAPLNLLTPPEGFEVSGGFNGYIHFGTSSAIIMTLIEKVNYMKLVEGMTDEYWERNKLTLVSEEEVKTDHGYIGKSYKLTFVLEEREFIRYMVYVGDLNNTLWLNITYPKLAEELVEPEILKCIQSVNLNPEDHEK